MEPHGYWFNVFFLCKRRLNLDKVYFLRGANIFEVAPLLFLNLGGANIFEVAPHSKISFINLCVYIFV